VKSSWKNLLFCAVMIAGTCVSAVERPPEAVRVGVVTQLTKETTRRYIGKVTAVDEVSLVARINGVILEQRFSSGDIVKKGDILFVLEDTTYRAAVQNAEAKLNQAKAEYEFARKNLERQTRLWNQKAVAESTFDEAVRQEATCKAAVLAAEAALLDARNNLSYTIIRSPIDGKAGRATFSPGNYVTPASGSLVTIVSVDSMYINIWITMSDYNRIFGGSFANLQNQASLEIKLADNSVFVNSSINPDACRIVFIDNKVDKDTDTIRIRAQVQNPDMRLIPDSLVSVTMSKKDGIRTVVPVSAIVSNSGINYVYVLDAENRASIRPVELGETQNGFQIIESGLQPGERIVIDGTHKVIPGNVVVPITVGGN